MGSCIFSFYNSSTSPPLLKLDIMPRALLAGSKALPGAASGRLLLGASRTTGRVLKSLYSVILLLPRFSLWLRSSLHFTLHMLQADIEQGTIVRRRQLYGSGERSTSYSLEAPGSSIPITTTHDESAISNSLKVASRPSLPSQNDKCRSHAPCSTNTDKARQTMRGATHALISFSLCHDMPDEAWW